MMNFKQLTVALALATTAPLAMAQQASEASVRELIKTIQADQQILQMNAVLERSMMPTFQKLMPADATPKQRELMERYVKTVLKISTEVMAPEKFMPVMVDIYQEVYSQEEVNAITAFYKTPAGQSMVAKTPLVAEKTMAKMQPLMLEFQTRMKAEMEKFAREIQANKPASR